MEIKHFFIPSVYTNCYLLWDRDSGAAAVIDPGDDVTDILLPFLAQEGLALRAIFLTHGHYDHVRGVAPLRAALPEVPVYLHPEDADRDDPLFPTAALDPLTLWRDGDVILLGGLQVEVLHTPGHSRGSVVLRCQDVLFTGDTLFAGSMGRTDLAGGSYDQLMASLRRLAGLEGDYQVLPGHDRATTLNRERKENYYMIQALEE